MLRGWEWNYTRMNLLTNLVQRRINLWRLTHLQMASKCDSHRHDYFTFLFILYHISQNYAINILRLHRKIFDNQKLSTATS